MEIETGKLKVSEGVFDPEVYPQEKRNSNTVKLNQPAPAKQRTEKRLMELEIAQIVVPNNRRLLRDIHQLADSIKDVGLLNPITVTNTDTSTDTLISTNTFDTFRLVAGFHRLEACKALGWQKIPAHIVALDGLKAELAEIDENLIRSELIVLERAEHLKRRKEIYEVIHPEIKFSGNEQMKAVRRGDKLSLRRKSPKLETEMISISSFFAGDIARNTGRHSRTIRQGVQIASRLSREVKDIIRDKLIADNRIELKRIFCQKMKVFFFRQKRSPKELYIWKW